MRVNGQQYGVPVYGETTLLMYRKDLFAKYGISGPPATMQELEQDAKTIYDGSGHSVYGITMRGQPGIQSTYIYAGFLRAFGGDWTSNGQPVVNSPQAVQAAAFWANLLHTYGPPGAPNYDWAQNRIEFDQGHAAMTIDASANGPYNEDPKSSTVVGKVGYAAVPYAAGVTPTGTNTDHSLEVHGLYLSKFSQHPLAAWLFMSWATSAQVQEQELQIAPQPGLTVTSVLNSSQYTQQYGAFVQEMLNQLSTGNPNYLPTGNAANTIIEDVGRALNTALVGQSSAKAALDSAQSQIQSGS
jgi:ABC-type glycerol-3-phosphate transport system substrate-binding protein